MGVSGSGKSTVAGILADQLGWDLEEGDELHPAANVAKMHAGIPLTDDDRRPWLESVSCWITEHTEAGLPGIITCSALKRIYRDRLRGENVVFVHLAGTRDTIGRRLDARLDHFMPGILLESQIATLEPPGPDENALVVDRPAAGGGGSGDHPAARAQGGIRLVDPGLRPVRPLGGTVVGPVAAGRAAVADAGQRCGASARWLVLACRLRGVGLGLGGVHGAGGVVRRPVDGGQHQRVGPGVDEVVFGAGGHDDQIALGDGPGLTADEGLPGAGQEGENLIVALVGLQADVATGRDGHHDQLGVDTGPQHAAEIGALLGDRGDLKMFHGVDCFVPTRGLLGRRW